MLKAILCIYFKFFKKFQKFSVLQKIFFKNDLIILPYIEYLNLINNFFQKILLQIKKGKYDKNKIV